MTKLQFWLIILMLTGIEDKVSKTHTWFDTVFLAGVVLVCLWYLFVDIKQQIRGRKNG